MNEDRIGQIRQIRQKVDQRDILTVGDVEFLLAVIDELRDNPRQQGNKRKFKLRHGQAIGVAGPATIFPLFDGRGKPRKIEVVGARAFVVDLA